MDHTPAVEDIDWAQLDSTLDSLAVVQPNGDVLGLDKIDMENLLTGENVPLDTLSSDPESVPEPAEKKTNTRKTSLEATESARKSSGVSFLDEIFAQPFDVTGTIGSQSKDSKMDMNLALDLLEADTEVIGAVEPVHLFNISRGLPYQKDIPRGLSKPVSCPHPSESFFVCGTEADDADLCNHNFLIIAELDKRSGTGARISRVKPIRWHGGVVAMAWLDSEHCVVADCATDENRGLHIGKLTVLTLRLSFDEEHLTMVDEVGAELDMPDSPRIRSFSDTPRAIAVTSKMVLSCDASGQMAVTSAGDGSEVYTYQCPDGTPSSVEWFLEKKCATYTAEEGKLNMMDVRGDWELRASLAVDTGLRDLYTHKVISENHICVATGTGAIALYDVRKISTPWWSITDEHTGGIGDMDFDFVTNRMAFFGRHGFSVYHYNHTGPSVVVETQDSLYEMAPISAATSCEPGSSSKSKRSRDTMQTGSEGSEVNSSLETMVATSRGNVADNMKHEGSFIRGTNYLAVTNWEGMFSCYNYPPIFVE